MSSVRRSEGSEEYRKDEGITSETDEARRRGLISSEDILAEIELLADLRLPRSASELTADDLPPMERAENVVSRLIEQYVTTVKEVATQLEALTSTRPDLAQQYYRYIQSLNATVERMNDLVRIGGINASAYHQWIEPVVNQMKVLSEQIKRIQ